MLTIYIYGLECAIPAYLGYNTKHHQLAANTVTVNNDRMSKTESSAVSITAWCCSRQLNVVFPPNVSN